MNLCFDWKSLGKDRFTRSPDDLLNDYVRVFFPEIKLEKPTILSSPIEHFFEFDTTSDNQEDFEAIIKSGKTLELVCKETYQNLLTYYEFYKTAEITDDAKAEIKNELDVLNSTLQQYQRSLFKLPDIRKVNSLSIGGCNIVLSKKAFSFLNLAPELAYNVSKTVVTDPFGHIHKDYYCLLFNKPLPLPQLEKRLRILPLAERLLVPIAPWEHRSEILIHKSLLEKWSASNILGIDYQEKEDSWFDTSSINSDFLSNVRWGFDHPLYFDDLIAYENYQANQS